MYRITSAGEAVDADGRTIPPDLRNRDWHGYQGWLSAGNEPQLADSSLVVGPRHASPLQLRRGLREMGALAAVRDYVARQDEALQDEWEYGIGFHRDDALVVAFCAALAIDRDALFVLAAGK